MPIRRLARAVCVDELEAATHPQTEQPSAKSDVVPRNSVRAKLWDGSLLIFEPLEVRDGLLRGQSSIYGTMSLPVDGIARLNFGEFEDHKFQSAFRQWTLRPGREPEFDEASP